MILGINAFHADASAAIVRDGELVAAISEERFSRVKHDARFPANAIKFCLSAAGATVTDVDHIAFPRDRRAHLVRKIYWGLRIPRLVLKRGKAAREAGTVVEMLAAGTGVSRSKVRAKTHYVEHHLAHGASAYFSSPWDSASIFTLDGLGDFSSMLWGEGHGGEISVGGRETFPDSVGFFYSAVTQFLGFHRYGDEFKIMGLAAYGNPVYLDSMKEIISDGHGMEFNLNLKYFRHHRHGAFVTWENGSPQQELLYSSSMEKLLGETRQPGGELTQRHRDIAASLQARFEDLLLELLGSLHQQTGNDRLCYAGGVALNSSGNGKILAGSPFSEMYIQPAATDDGLALGAALFVSNSVLREPRSFEMTHAYWGHEETNSDIEEAIERSGVRSEGMDYDRLTEKVADLIEQGQIVGWFQGRSEWGPRALGNRSIVADARSPQMKDILNRRVKHREPFRPFAPSVLEEHFTDWFDQSEPSPFMLMTYPVKEDKRALIPATTHEDGTGRLQTVSKSTNPLYWTLIDEVRQRTGVPVVLNTSFNENEPIVNNADEALACLARADLDVVAIGNYLVHRT